MRTNGLLRATAKVVASALLIAFCQAAAWGAGPGPDYISLSADEFEKAIASNDVIRVDVRSQEEWEEGHIPGTIFIDVQKDNFLEKAKALLPKDKTVAVNCRSGVRSRTAAEKLSEAGYKVINLENGFAGWQEAGKPVVTASKVLPAVVRRNGATRLEVDGKPFLVLSGELHNSTSSSESYMESIAVWEQMKEANFNTVIASASWELVEKEEGKYDFSSVDHIIRNARLNGLKVVMIWFASWKNGNSTYAPGYVKRNPKKYPLVQTQDGRYLDVLSTFSKDAMEADKKAYVALMNHIKEIDPDHTVIMMQVENEIGILGSVRDFSPAAQKAWKGQVPADLMQYLSSHKGRLFPELEKVWKQNGYKMSGTWEEVFGKSHTKADDLLADYPYYTEEIFQAYYYAKYVNEITAAGKAAYGIPMYVNNWLRQPGMITPGEYPSGSPLPEVLDIWRAAAPAVDFTAPDIYINEFEWVLSQFALSDNPIFIPECRADASKALYAYGEYDALGYAPFGFDGSQAGGAFPVNSSDFDNLGKCYGILKGMDQIIIQNYGSDKLRGLRITEDNASPAVEMGDYILTARSSVRNQRAINYGQGAAQMAIENAQLAAASQQQAQAGALILQTSPDEFYIVGINVSFSFASKKAGGPRIMTEAIEEGTFVDGKWVPGRRLNGDENRVGINGVGAVRVVLYPSTVTAQGR
ncbi:MAG: DUF5597 domain-containing protein [Bacteroidales bacterium]|nr:DUF5597 domain-containing protein [Bacteroidales bacterium]